MQILIAPAGCDNQPQGYNEGFPAIGGPFPARPL
jgi:hypothetical protein